VTAEDSGLPLANSAAINKFDDAGTRIGAVDTDVNGEYSIQIPSGNYWVHVDTWDVSDHYINEFHDNTPCPVLRLCGEWLTEIIPIDLTAAEVTFDAVLTLGIVLEGNIVEKGSSNGIESSEINVFAADGNRLFNPVADVDGYFKTVALPVGDYYAFTEADHLGTGFSNEIYQDIPCSGDTCWQNVIEQGTAIIATNPGETYSIAIELAKDEIFSSGFEALFAP